MQLAILTFIALAIPQRVIAQTNITLAIPQRVIAQTNITLMNAEQAFSQAQVVPDVLPLFSPTAVLDVVFTDPSTMQTIAITPGTNLTIEQTTNEPQFSLTSNDTSVLNETFVVAIVDPDAPTPQNTSISQFRHFLGGNFQITEATANITLLANNTAALTEYMTPAPPAGSDPHRYVIILFVQSDTFDAAAPLLVNASTPRTNFNLTTFAAAVGLGNPIAGNFFLTGPDNSTAAASVAPSATSSAVSTAGPSEAPAGASAASTGAATAPAPSTSPSNGSNAAMGICANLIRSMYGVVIILMFELYLAV